MKNSRKVMIPLAFAAASLLALTGCSVDNGTGNAAKGDKSGGAASCSDASVAYITSATSVSFWRSLSVGINEAAAKKGAKVTVYDSNNSQSKQLQNAQDAVTAGVDLIILSPTDSASAPAVLDVAARANIPVVIADIGTDSGEYLSFIKTDNTSAAKEAGEFMAAQLKAKGVNSGKIGIIGISQSRQNGKDRTAGFSEPVTAAGYDIVSLLESSTYTRSESLGFTQDLLAGNADLAGIFTEHDEATQGALTALDGALTPILVGFDGSPDTLQALKNGVLAGTAMQQPVLMGEAAFTAGCDHLDGKDVEKQVLVDTVFVTRDNVRDLESKVQDTVFKE